MGGTVVVIGATGPLGRAVTAGLVGDGAEVRTVGADARDLAATFEGADAAVLLGHPVRHSTILDGTGLASVDEPTTRRILDAFDAAGMSRLVWLSSAMVYGAWPDNPIPLTEDAPRRPNPGVRFAEDRSDRERQVLDWSTERPQVPVAVLRPTIVVSADHPAWLGRSPWSPPRVQVGDAEAPSQFVHVDDLASAVVLALGASLDGAFNVAPDGWIPAAELRALSGPVPRLHLPAPVAERLARWRWRVGLTGTPPAVRPYTRLPWVVANDRIRAAGWAPGYANDEAFVFADDGGWFDRLDPRRRQLLALGTLGAVGVALVTGVLLLARRARSG